MIPWEATIIPNYLLIRQMGWTDTFHGAEPRPSWRRRSARSCCASFS